MREDADHPGLHHRGVQALETHGLKKGRAGRIVAERDGGHAVSVGQAKQPGGAGTGTDSDTRCRLEP